MEEEELQRPVCDSLFRQKRKKGAWRLVVPPCEAYPIADTHAHVQLLPDPPLALARAAANGVGFICTIVDIWEDGPEVFSDLDAWREQAGVLLTRMDEENARSSSDPALKGAVDRFGVALEEFALPRVFGDDGLPEVPAVAIACGCHPHNAEHYDDALEAALEERLKDERVVAVGEIGLDYHYDYSPRDRQREAFRRQIRLAKKHGLPVVLHLREAHDDGFAILEEEGFPEAGTLLHCFNLDGEEARRWVDAGCHIAFGGPLTFKNADDVREAACSIPGERIVTETDCPYMTPEPMRGSTCGPEHVVFTAALLCDIEGFKDDAAQREEFLRRLFRNALRFFRVGSDGDRAVVGRAVSRKAETSPSEG